jgi:hypothetical protein
MQLDYWVVLAIIGDILVRPLLIIPIVKFHQCFIVDVPNYIVCLHKVEIVQVASSGILNRFVAAATI